MAEQGTHRLGGLARAATLMAAATVASRLLGVAREIVAAALFGASNDKAAYVIAYYVPFFVQRLLLGGTLSIIFIPTISRYLARGDDDGARRLSGSLFTLVLLGGIGMVAVGELAAPLLVRIAAPGFAAIPGMTATAIALTRIIFVAMLFLALSLFVTGFLQAHHQFTIPAVSPLLFNLVIIGGTLVLGPRIGIAGLALSWILGTAAQFAVQLPAARALGLGFRAADIHHPAVREIARLAVPAILGLAVVEINAYVGRFFASLLPAASAASPIAVLDYAYEVVQAPAGIFAISIATAIFPLLSRHAASGASDDLRATGSLGLRTMLVAILPVTAGILALAAPLVALVFQRGEFGSAATAAVSATMTAYAVGLPAIGAYYVVTRTYYALHDMATPVRVGVGMVALNAVLDYLLMRIFGVAGIALATSLVATINIGTLLWLLRRRLAGIDGVRLVRTVLRAGTAAGAAGAVMVATSAALRGVIGGGPLSALAIQVGGAAVAGLAAYVAACVLLRVDELRTIRDLLRGRQAPDASR
ncbi:MAG TPA: murein biosynthesis integral membrane protein MurJ [bacterium]|nr:murein biosynthesis integral membrane protein MurJ [bacterium]